MVPTLKTKNLLLSGANSFLEELFPLSRKTNENGRVAFSESASIHLTLLHSERPKLYTILAFLSAIGLEILYALHELWCKECVNAEYARSEVAFVLLLYIQ